LEICVSIKSALGFRLWSLAWTPTPWSLPTTN